MTKKWLNGLMTPDIVIYLIKYNKIDTTESSEPFFSHLMAKTNSLTTIRYQEAIY